MKGLGGRGEARGGSRGGRSSLEKSKQLVKPQPGAPVMGGGERHGETEKDRERQRCPETETRNRDTGSRCPSGEEAAREMEPPDRR